MNFSFEPTNIIRTVKRTAKVTLAGFVIFIAASAAPVRTNLSDLSLSDPLEKKIALCIPSQSNPALTISQFSEFGKRYETLRNSLKITREERLSVDAEKLWKDMLPLAADIPFEKVLTQFDSESESFFFAFSFRSGQRLEATTYVDEEDKDVYFSVTEKGKIIFQNILSREAFFSKASSTWRGFSENV